MMLQMVNCLGVRQKISRNAEARLAQPGNERDADQVAQPSVPTLNIEVANPMKYLRNIWRLFDLSLLNCKVEFDLLCISIK